MRKLPVFLLLLTVFCAVLSGPAAAADGAPASVNLSSRSAGYSVRNLEISGSTVSADYDAETDAVLAVRIRGEADDAVLEEKKKAAAEGSGSESIAFSSLPYADGFYVDAWLEDSGGNRLSDVAGNASCTRWAEAARNQKASDFSPDRVVVFRSGPDCSYREGSFLVLQEDVNLIRDTTHSIERLESQAGQLKAGSFRIAPLESAPASWSLREGEKVFIDLPGAYYMGTAENVRTEGGEYLFSLKPAGVSEEAAASGEPEIYTDYIQELNSGCRGTVTLPFSLDIPEAFSISGTATATVFVEASLEPGPKPVHGNKNFFLRMTSDITIPDVKVTLVSGDYNLLDYTLVPIPFPGLAIPYVGGVDSDIRLSIDINATGTVGFEVGFYTGFEFWYTDKDHMSAGSLCKTPHWKLNELAITGSVSIGFVSGPRADISQICSIGLSFGPSLVITASNDIPEYADEEKVSPYKGLSENAKYKKWHACEKNKCVQGDGHIRLSISIGASFGKRTFNLYEYNIDFPPLFNFYHSFTYGSGEVDECPHYGYRLVVQVTDQDGDPLGGVPVSYWPNTTLYAPEDRYKQVASATTDSTGLAVLYVPVELTDVNSWAGALQPYKTTVTAVYDGPNGRLRATRAIEEKGYGGLGETFDREHWEKKDLEMPEVTLTVEVLSTIRFEDPGAVQAENMPEPVSFNPLRSGGVNLPDTVPVKSGNHFTGWNTEKDGSGDSYQPGALVVTQRDLVLYAQFQPIADTYVILYNANGGTGAPAAQVVPFGSDARLSDRQPEWEGLRFLGWSTEDNSAAVEYEPGAVLSNPENRSVIVLYAVWQYSPVTAVHIRYHLNGADSGETPPDQWIRPGSTLVISDLVPEREMYDFLGWSLDQNAGEAMYHAGEAHRFFTDTDLYAVWIISPVPAPVRIRFDLNGGTLDGQTGVIERMYAAGTVIAIPGPPVREGYTFRYWQGSEYYPGDQYTVRENHTLTAVWDQKLPKTGDASRPVIWIVLTGLGLVCLLTQAASRRRKG